MENGNLEPEPKLRKSLSLKTEIASKRFAITSSKDVEKVNKGFVPENTKRRIEWAVCTFHAR